MTATDLPAGCEILADGYTLVEAPRADGQGGVWFSDALGGGVHHWRDGTVETFLPERRGIGGMALHRDGGVVVSGRDLTHVGPDGDERVVWPRPEGTTGLNDLCAMPGGAVVVGALRFRPFAGEDPAPGEFWYVDRDHDCIDVPDVWWPNGCGVDADRRRVYTCDYARGVVWVREVAGLRPFVETPTGDADGLAVDHEGGVWVALPKAGAVARFTPGGDLDRMVEVGRMVVSCAFDGAGTMFLTTMATGPGQPGALLALPAPVPGPMHLLTDL